MLAEKLKDQWICSCGNWVARQLSWCPECCEDREVHGTEELRDRETDQGSLITD